MMTRKTFSINPIVTHKGSNLVKNPEGGTVYKERSDLSLFLNMSGFKLKNSFYWKADESLAVLESLIDENADFEYKLAVAKFLSSILGIRLSPVILLTREAMMLKGGGSVLYEANAKRAVIKNVTAEVMDRPDKIANSLSYAQFHAGTFKWLPPFYKKALRDAFERFDAYTLRKFKLKNRAVKTADMIKALRPHPKNAKMSELYVAIIENRGEAAIEKDTVITEVLSDTKKTKKEKKEWIAKNVSNIPFNALMNNLRSLDGSPETVKGLGMRVRNALRVENGLPSVKVANPFDILVAGLHCDNEDFMKEIDGALADFASKVELGLDGLDVAVLVDVSGSMGPLFGGRVNGELGIEIAADYMALLIPMLKNTNLSMYSFNMSVQDKNSRVALYKRAAQSPILVRDMFLKDFKVDGGTALADAVRKIAAKKPDLLIVISDEVSWADRGSNRVLDVGVPVLAVNPFPQGKFTVFSPDKPIVKLSALDGKILYYIPMLANFKRFKSWIKDWAFK